MGKPPSPSPAAKRRKKKKRGRSGRPPVLHQLQKRALLKKSPNNDHPHSPILKNPTLNRRPNRSLPPPSPIPLRRSTRRNHDHGLVSSPLNSSSSSSSEEEEEEVEEDEGDEEEEEEQQQREEKGQKAAEWRMTGSGNGLEMDHGPTSTPLPDKKLLVLILDKLQKKDTRGAFSEPVDPEELPDYHEIIEKPMDFGTVRKKLDAGIYSSMEQFEADVSLICSNAMEYNAANTIYFRQARSIKELAKVEFENLKQRDGDVEQPLEEPIIEQEPKHSIEQPLKPRRGRPPGSTTKRKFLESSSLDHVPSSFPSAAACSSGGDDGLRSSHYNLRRGPSLLKFHHADVFSRSSYGGRHVENSAPRTSYMKGSRLQIEPEDSRRGTYIQPTHNLSSLASIGQEHQTLVPVGLHADHGYARSLARFAANLGPVVWRVASKKIKSALRPGVEFGPGWVAESNASSTHQLVSQKPLSLDTSKYTPYAAKLPHPSTAYSGAALSYKPSMSSEEMVDARGLNAQRELTVANGVFQGSGSQIPCWTQDSSATQPGNNRVSCGLGLATLEEVRPGPSSVNSCFVQGSFACQTPNMLAGSKARPSPLVPSSLITQLGTNPSREGPLPMDYWAGMDVRAAEPRYQGRPFWPEVPAQDRWVSPSIHLDMNGGFQASSSQVLEIGSSPQVDLMLQL